MSGLDPSPRAEEVAATLLTIGAVSIRVSPPFRYRSGLLGPIYTDTRLLCSYPGERCRVVGHLAALLDGRGLRPAVVAGVATAGIPHAAWLADRLGLPMACARGDAEEQGRGERIEGTPHGGPPEVVVVEDLVTTGEGALDAVAAIREGGGLVRHCLAVCTYGFARAEGAFARAGVTPLALCTFDDLVRVAARYGWLSAHERGVVLDWRVDPEGWAARHGRVGPGRAGSGGAWPGGVWPGGAWRCTRFPGRER